MKSFFSQLFERPLKKGIILQDKYEIIKFIGRGSYGLVYLANNELTSTHVIVKQNRERKEHNCREMIMHEAQMLSRLNHFSIPKCLDYFQEKERSFLVMEYIQGKNFEDIVLNDGGTFDEKESLEILYEVVRVVQYLHQNKIIHRDLRLPNIIKNGSQICIIDFGLSLSSDHISKHNTDKEDKNPFREKSFQSDFYALGHFLLFLLYSTFETTDKNEKSWEEELMIKNGTKDLLRKLLKIDGSFEDINEIAYRIEQLLI